MKSLTWIPRSLRSSRRRLSGSRNRRKQSKAVRGGYHEVAERLEERVLLTRINAGGPTLAGPGFVPDDGFQNGTGLDYPNTAAIDLSGVPAGTPEALFQTVLWDAPGGSELQFDIPADAGSQVRVELFFSEIWPGAFANGAREFDVAIDGQLVLDNLDIFSEVGANAGLVKTFDLRSDGNIDIDLFHVVQNPAIAGIQVTELAPNVVPTITDVTDLAIDEDASTMSLDFTVDDADGDPLTVSVTSDNPALVPPGGLQLGGSGNDRTIVVTPTPELSGSATIRLTASDGFGSAFDEFLLTVNPVNDLPVTMPDSAIIEENQSVDISVLQNDTDIDGSLDPASIQITTAPTSGSATPNADGTVTFAPASIGNFFFEYTVDDDAGGTSIPTRVDVNVTDNLPPTISTVANQTVTVGRSSLPVAFTVGDPEGDLLTVTSSVDDPGIVSAVTTSGSGTSRNVSVTAGDMAGTATVTLTVDDGQNQAESMFQVTVVENQAPTISTIPDQIVGVNGAATAGFTVDDPEGDALTVTPSVDNPDSVSAVALSSTGANRTVTVFGGNEIGVSNVTLTVDDGSNQAESTFRVDVGRHLNAAGPALPGIIPFIPEDPFRNVGNNYSRFAPIDLSNVGPDIPQALFQTVLWDAPGGPELQFDIPVANGEIFQVDLYFAEIWPGAFGPGDRQFDVLIDGQLVLDNLDIFAEVGADTALVKSFEVTGDGNLDIDLLHVIQNPAIAGITVTPAELPVIPGLLQERRRFVAEQTAEVDLGQIEGTRTITVDIAPDFDASDPAAAIEDTFAIYLVDPDDPTQTLLDRGTPGTALFTLSGDQADFTPGLVRFDGSTVSIDATSLASEDAGLLVFQLINSDTDDGSEVGFSNILSTVDPLGTQGPMLNLPTSPVNPGSALDINSLTTTDTLQLSGRNIRFDSTTGRYTAELTLENTGATLSRQTAVVFPGLPSGVSVSNASGTDGLGNPYISFADAIPNGGLQMGTTSSPVQIEIDNPGLLRFSLTPDFFSSGANQAPTFGPVGDLTVMPGDRLEVDLNAFDPDGDLVTFTIETTDMLPNGHLNGVLVFAPQPLEIGTYDFTLIGSDGSLETREDITLNVVPDPITTTRISGLVLDTNEQPLAGVRIELGGTETFTAADGSFLLDFGMNPFPGDTLIVHGEEITGPNTYPFIAEGLPLLLEVGPFENINNVIARPIYLPALNSGTTIDPSVDNTVSRVLQPGEMPVEVMVAANSLMDQQNNPFTGDLGITEVPPDLTPAALPGNLLPDIVVTIQPGEMVFTTPAPLNFPNRAGWEPGTILDLWSINPTTGEFEDVGDMQVSPDGLTIETISGGVRNSSWHFPTPPDPDPDDNMDDDHNEDEDCDECKANGPGNSEVELHSGSLREWHNLVTYDSLGATRGLSLQYDSERANPMPIVHFGYSNLPNRNDRYLVARLEFMRGDFGYMVPGNNSGDFGLPGGENFWEVQGGGDIRAALQQDFTQFPTGVYDFSLDTGILRFQNGTFTGATSNQTGEVLHVNSIGSVFGNGWGLAGLLQIVENPDGSVLLVDGDGGELHFDAPANPGDAHVSPPGDFTALMQQPDGTYERTWPNVTVQVFNTDGFISTTTDRNGNVTTWDYSAPGRLTTWTDPVGLQTALNYTGDNVTSIVDPAGRTTSFDYDIDGNLIRITDPDGSVRRFSYNSRNLMIGEINKRGFQEQIFYNHAGKVEREIRPDGTEMFYDAVQSQVLMPTAMTLDPNTAPTVDAKEAAVATYSDPNGNVTEFTLDKQGQMTGLRDGAGFQAAVNRNDENLPQVTTDGRGFTTDFMYDAQGNPLSVTDRVGAITGGSIFITGHDSDDHSNGEYQRAGLDFLTFGRQAAGAAEEAIRAQIRLGYLGNSNGGTRGASASGYTDRTFIDLDNPNWGDTAFDGTFDVLMIGTGGDYVFGSGSAALNAEADRFAEYFNDGGGIFVNTDQGSLGQSFYDFLPTFGATQAARGGTGVYTATPEGLAIGLTEAIVDRDVTHTEYQGVDTSIFRVFETHNITSDPVAIGLFQGFIGAGGIGGTSTQFFTYDPTFSQATTFTDGQGRRFFYDVDPTTGDQLSMTRVMGNVDDAMNGETDDLVTTYTYTAEGLIDTVTDPLGRVTDNNYNAAGLLISTTFAEGTTDEATMTYDYDPAGNRTLMVDGNGNQTSYEYDALNRLIRTVEQDPDGAGPLTSPVTTITYDEFGNVATTTDPNGNTTTNQYDELDRLISITDPDPDGAGPLPAPVTSYTYDPAGNIETITDPNGHVSTHTYDSRNRRVTTTDPDGGVTQFGYDTDNNLTVLIDPVNNITRFTYDARNRLVEETDPFGNSITYEYDASSNLIRKTDRNDRVTEFEYDDVNRLLTENWLAPDESVLNAINYTYDAASNLLTLDDNQSALTFTYDARDRVATVDNAGTPDVPNVVLTYTYDDVSNILSVTDTIDASPGATTGYAYDGLNRLIGLTQSGTDTSNKRVDFTYNPLGQYTAIDRFSDLAGTQLVIGTSYTYDGQNRLTRLDHQNAGGSSVAFYDYAYDTESRITQITDIDGTTSYGYDDRDELTSATYTDPAQTDESYQYDANGNRTQSNAQGSAYVTDLGNRLTSDGTYNYEYDREGNMTRRILAATGEYREFTWDHRNRLISVNDFDLSDAPLQEVSYSYDSIDRRISKSVDASPTDAIDALFTHFVLDRDNVLMDFVDQDGSGPGQNTLDQRYLHGDMVDDVFAQDNGSGSSLWLLGDHLGTIRDATSDAGDVSHATYDAFGKRIASSSSFSSIRFGFTGRELDTSVGLYYYRTRYYDAAPGRFISEDSLRLAGGDANVYRYVANNPVSHRDPAGTYSGSSWSEAIQQIWGVGPFDAWTAGELAEEASATAGATGLPGAHNGPQDAFRHCYWSCRMAQEIGASQAQTVGDIHEKCGKNPPKETAMDQKNNAEGRKLGTKGKNCRTECLGALASGTLQSTP